MTFCKKFRNIICLYKAESRNTQRRYLQNALVHGRSSVLWEMLHSQWRKWTKIKNDLGKYDTKVDSDREREDLRLGGPQVGERLAILCATEKIRDKLHAWGEEYLLHWNARDQRRCPGCVLCVEHCGCGGECGGWGVWIPWRTSSHGKTQTESRSLF